MSEFAPEQFPNMEFARLDHIDAKKLVQGPGQREWLVHLSSFQVRTCGVGIDPLMFEAAQSRLFRGARDE